MVDEGTTGLNEIPFAVAYANRYGLLESRPPLEDIAELNLKAYQIQSDLDNQLHISSVPFLAIYGYPASAEEITAGPGEALALPSESKVEFVSPPATASMHSSGGWIRSPTRSTPWAWPQCWAKS